MHIIILLHLLHIYIYILTYNIHTNEHVLTAIDSVPIR